MKGTRYLNVKQGRARMHWASWLQQYKSKQWIDAGKRPAASFPVDVPKLMHALVGGAGSGKTTTLRVIEALLGYFVAPDSLRKSAPTNTAARLLGGRVRLPARLGRRRRL